MGWTGLDRIQDIEGLAERDKPIMAALRATLEKHGALDRFGICLLHSHFDMTDDEVLVERVDADARTLSISVELVHDFAHGELVPTSWRLDGPTSDPVLHCFRPRGSTFHER